MNSAMGKAVADVALRVWTPQHAQLLFVKQVAPNIDELTNKARPGPNPLTKDFPTGAWGAEERDYHVSVRVNAAGVGEEMLAARISLVVDGNVVGQGLVKAMWSEDEQLTARINPEVAHYTGQQELAEAILTGSPPARPATSRRPRPSWARAVAARRRRRQRLDHPTAGQGRRGRQPGHGAVEEGRRADSTCMALDTRSTKTTRVRPGGPARPRRPAGPAGFMSATCPNGHTSAAADYCDSCGARIGGVAATRQSSGTGASTPQPRAPPSAPTWPAATAPTAAPPRFPASGSARSAGSISTLASCPRPPHPQRPRRGRRGRPPRLGHCDRHRRAASPADRLGCRGPT